MSSCECSFFLDWQALDIARTSKLVRDKVIGFELYTFEFVRR